LLSNTEKANGEPFFFRGWTGMIMRIIKNDPLAEIREVREKISAIYGHDTNRLIKHYKELEKRYKGRMAKDSLKKST
jgi:hypothetical protein